HSDCCTRVLHYLQCYARIFLLFFFLCSGHHRDLHSFPTRRSSDLDGAGGGGDGVHPRLVHRAPDPGGRLAGLRQVAWGRDLRGVDRKSTRLNSSHSQISYAVFCLKKKKKKKYERYITITTKYTSYT